MKIQMHFVRRGPVVAAAAAMGMALVAALIPCDAAVGQEDARGRPADDRVPELARYLDQVEIYAPSVYRHLAVFPIRLRDDGPLRGNWLTMDQALARGVLVIQEKGDRGVVPTVIVENRSREDYVFILAGELLAGGKQTRTVRQDILLAPGQTVDVNVFCVEAHRWEGETRFKSGSALAPASLQQELRLGGDQHRIWSEVARNNAALGAENSTGSLIIALQTDKVRAVLIEIRDRVLPQVPGDTVGIIVVDRDRAVGAEFFGRHGLAVELLPKLLDAYAVDLILKRGDHPPVSPASQQEAAIAFFRRVQQAHSQHVATLGAGVGIRTRGGGLLGDGVSLDGAVVHYGVQIQDRIIPLPSRPIVERPR